MIANAISDPLYNYSCKLEKGYNINELKLLKPIDMTLTIDDKHLVFKEPLSSSLNTFIPALAYRYVVDYQDDTTVTVLISIQSQYLGTTKMFMSM